MARSNFVIFKGQKYALGCGICVHGDSEMKTERARCARCMLGKTQGFEMKPEYRSGNLGEADREEGPKYEEIDND